MPFPTLFFYFSWARRFTSAPYVTNALTQCLLVFCDCAKPCDHFSGCLRYVLNKSCRYYSLANANYSQSPFGKSFMFGKNSTQIPPYPSVKSFYLWRLFLFEVLWCFSIFFDIMPRTLVFILNTDSVEVSDRWRRTSDEEPPLQTDPSPQHTLPESSSTVTHRYTVAGERLLRLQRICSSQWKEIIFANRPCSFNPSKDIIFCKYFFHISLLFFSQNKYSKKNIAFCLFIVNLYGTYVYHCPCRVIFFR